ncbi:MAG: transporter ATP-binding protein [Betaproteobacteria bacterium]|nr:transporter ATP-binding protein [Betaproteobacteria bacterium]
MTGAHPSGPLLRVHDLSVSFRTESGTDVPAVRSVSFDVPASSTVALVGESGSGKSVTALSVLALLPQNAQMSPESRIVFRNRDLLSLAPRDIRTLRGREISMIFQEPMSSLNPVFTIGFQLTEGLRRHLGLTRRSARARAIELLDEVGMPEPGARIDAYPFELSGGQQQRVMIAMAIACEPALLIADEPTTALDVTVQKQILELIAALQQRRQMAVLFITHDLRLVGEIADRVVVMRDGRVREQGVAREVFAAPHDAYTRALLACRPPLHSRPSRLPVIADFLSHDSEIGDRPQFPQSENRGLSPILGAERSRGLRGDETVVLEARHLAKSFYRRAGLFGKHESRVVRDASFSLSKGKTLGIVGESGSGKTTVALMLMRLQAASGGVVLFEGKDLLSRHDRDLALKRRIQIVFQNPYASLNPRFTAGQILIEPMHIHRIGANAGERETLALAMLDKVGLPRDSFFKYPHEFSGGQRQRIAIARCLTMRPDVLICDESVSALDVSVQAQLLNLLQDLQDEYGMSYIFISHDLAVVRYMADEVMVMNAGEVVEIANADELYANPRHPYTRNLLASMPRDPDPAGVRSA